MERCMGADRHQRRLHIAEAVPVYRSSPAAIDLSAGFIDHAKNARTAAAELRVGDAQAIPLEPASSHASVSSQRPSHRGQHHEPAGIRQLGDLTCTRPDIEVVRWLG